MEKIYAIVRKIRKNQDGATSIEYAFVALLISIVIVVAVVGIGESVKTFFLGVSDGFKGNSK